MPYFPFNTEYIRKRKEFQSVRNVKVTHPYHSRQAWNIPNSKEKPGVILTATYH